MAIRSLLRKVDGVRCLSPVSVSNNTAQTSANVDTRGSESLLLVLTTAVLADADATFDVAVEHSDTTTASDFSAVAAKDLLGSLDFDFDDDDVVKLASYVGGKRYVRVKVTPSNNTGASTFAVTAIKGHLNYSPAD